MATGYINIIDLVFLLYELPPPLGKPSVKCNNLHIGGKPFEKQPEVAKLSLGIQNEERFLVNVQKGIVIKKVNALDLLKDLNIKIYSNNNAHFADVFKALLSRIFLETDKNFKLNSSLSNKMKDKWKKKHNS